MDVSKAFTDPALEETGAWVPYLDGSELRVARIGTAAFTRRLEAKMKPHRHKEKAGNLDNETQTRILCECLAETILLDWKGFTNKGKAFPYTQEAAFDLLMKSMDFRNDIAELATAQDTFRKEDLEDDAKN